MEPIKHVIRTFDDSDNTVKFTCSECERFRVIYLDDTSQTLLVDTICNFFEEHRYCKEIHGLQQ